MVRSKVKTGDDIYRVIKSLGETDWAGYSPSFVGEFVGEDADKNPHYTVWRWKNPNPEIGRLIVEAVESFKGQIEWEIRSRNRIPKLGGTNWIIEPPIKREFWDKHKDLPASKIARLIKQKEPEIGILSNQDVPQLAEHIKRYVEENRQSGNIKYLK